VYPGALRGHSCGFVVLHFQDVAHVRFDVGEELAKLRRLPEAAQVAFGRIPANDEQEQLGIFFRAQQLVARAVGRGGQRRAGASIGVAELGGTIGADAITNDFRQHGTLQ
jgi:hypothetical protein